MTTSLSNSALKPVSCVSRRIALEQQLSHLAVAGPEAINDRLCDLGREWSTGRLTKAVAGAVVLVGLILTTAVSPWFTVVTIAGGIMLAWYAVGQRSLLAALFHAMGFRTGTEIHEEILALKALRGDFRDLPTVHEIEDKDAIGRLEGEGGIVVEPEEAKADPLVAAREVVSATRIDPSPVTA